MYSVTEEAVKSNTDLKDFLTHSLTERGRLHNRVISLCEELIAQKNLLSATHEDYEKLIEKYDHLQLLFNEQQETQNLVDSIQTNTAQESINLRCLLDNALSDVTRLKSENEKLKNQLEIVDNERETANFQLIELRSSLESIKQQLDERSKDKSVLENQLVEIAKASEHKYEALEQAYKENFIKAVNEYKSTLLVDTTAEQQSTSTVSDLKLTLAKKDKAISRLTRWSDKLSANNKTLSKKVDYLDKDRKKWKRRYKKLKRETKLSNRKRSAKTPVEDYIPELRCIKKFIMEMNEKMVCNENEEEMSDKAAAVSSSTNHSGSNDEDGFVKPDSTNSRYESVLCHSSSTDEEQDSKSLSSIETVFQKTSKKVRKEPLVSIPPHQPVRKPIKFNFIKRVN